MDDLGTVDACKANDLKGSNGNALPLAGQLMEPSFAEAGLRPRILLGLGAGATPTLPHIGMDTCL